MMYVGYEAVKTAIVRGGPAGNPAGQVAYGPQDIVFDKTRTVKSLHHDAYIVIGKLTL